jgi:hypothetical protein
MVAKQVLHQGENHQGVLKLHMLDMLLYSIVLRYHDQTEMVKIIIYTLSYRAK